MRNKSYLLAIDGSEKSRSAAYLAWELASHTGARVVAQHVVDTQAVWQFLSYDRAGFVGSGLYMDARERITDMMRSIGEVIMMAYGTQMSGRSREFENYIDEGDPATEIARRAHEHDLVIIGYDDCKCAGRSKLFEELERVCPCPILLIRNTSKPWSRLEIFATSDLADFQHISSIHQLGALLGIPVEVCLDTSVAHDAIKQFACGDWSSLGACSIKPGTFEELMDRTPKDALLVVSDQANAGQQAAIRNTARIRAFLDDSERGALLLWRDTGLDEIRCRLAS